MDYRTLGRSGAAVSTYCLGTMTFGKESDEATSHAQLDRYLDVGGNFVDTANVYAGGESESIIGRWLAARDGARDQIVLATKGRFSRAGGRNDIGGSRLNLSRALEASLRRLQTDHVDLYQVHAFDALTPLEETLRFLDDAVSAGKILYAGVSNYTGWQLQKAADISAFRGWTPIVTLQPQYNLLMRGIEHELVDVCLNEGIGILPWSPLGGGWLTGKYRRDEQPTGATRLGDDPDRGMEAFERRNALDRTWQVVDAVREVADRRGASMAQIALAWVTGRPAVTSTILGARTVEQLDDNLGAVDVVLDDDDLTLLDQASAPVVDEYPYGAGGVAQRDRRID